MSDLNLAEFQQAAVDTICDRLLDRRGPRRFLLADEVGLGKTIVARGVIEELMRRRRERDFVVVYLCSNGEIADQNRQKLDPGAGKPIRRITQLAREKRPEGKLKLYSFTPGTSLSEGTGLAWERQLLLFLVHRVLRQDVRKGNWREYFRCGAGPESWREQTTFRALRGEFHRKLAADLQRRVGEEWRKPATLEKQTIIPAGVLLEDVQRFDPEDVEQRRRRNRLVGVLRTAVQRVLIDDLEPDLVILDEVQRFRNVIDEAGSTTSIAARLFDRGAAVLILSATPYRMLSLDHEGEGHYGDFLDTVRFLYAARGKDEVERLKPALDAFRVRLESGEFLNGNDVELLASKTTIEASLRKVISRTERNWYIEEHGKGVEECRPSDGETAVPRREELADFIALRRFLLDKVDTSQHVTEYWKSCPAPFTFMDAQYAPMAATRKRKAVPPPGVVTSPAKLGDLGARNLRFRELFKMLFGQGDAAWRYLWTRPTYTYYRDDFFGNAEPSKALVFSGWRFVPKAIALLTSHEAEQRIAPRGRLWEGEDRPPLRFTEKGSFHIFDLCFPSPALASLIDPAALADKRITSRDLLKRTCISLKTALVAAGVEIGDTNRSSVWRVVARLEGDRGKQIAGALEGSEAYSSKDVTERFGEHVDRFVEWTKASEPLRISEERLTHIARIAAFSPAVALLRAFWSVYPGARDEVPPGLIDLCFEGLRSYFNRRSVRAIVEKNTPGAKTYVRSALNYCERAHFQSLADEYLYLVRHVIQRATPAEAAEHVGRVLGLGPGTPNINLTTATGRIRDESFARRSHFALAFGDEAKAEAGIPSEQSQASRKTAVREAFNSPFWPFVLATTSVGQEGLDFHLYCRDIVHWNLPSNPVDLEQREGRINRRDGMAVRRSIAKVWTPERIAHAAPSNGIGNFWERVFDAVEAEPGMQRYKHGLYPHWIFDSEDSSPERIRRHLFFYADSQDAKRYEELKERLALYRLVFGQPRQQDLLDRIQRNLAGGRDLEARHAALTRYMINLSALGSEHADARAVAEASNMINSVEHLERLLADVDRIERARTTELASVANQLAQLKATISAYLAGDSIPHEMVRMAAQALIYLRDPYDALLDQHIGLGLEDDCARILRAAATLESVA